MLSLANVDPDSNRFQKHLVPEKSSIVRSLLRRAGEWGKCDSMFYSRFLTVALVVGAIVLSLFNTISYLLEIPLKILLNVVHIYPKKLVEDFVVGITCALRSFLFVSFGITFLVAGVLFPKVVFSYFAPNTIETPLTQLYFLKESLKEEKVKLEKIEEENQRLIEALSKNADYQNELEKKLNLKR